MAAKDPRPLTERSFQLEAIANLTDFFAVETCPFPLTAKFFDAPQRRDVFKLFETLLNILDPQLLKGLNVERDLPGLISAGLLPYPYSFPKSAFLAISAPTTWPHTLALLSWLAALAKASKCPAVEPATFAAYAAWMNERTDKEEKQKAVAFREAHAAVAQARAETHAAAEELNRFRSFGAELLKDCPSLADAQVKLDEVNAQLKAILAEQEALGREYSQEEHKQAKLKQGIASGTSKNEADMAESERALSKLGMTREEVEQVQARLSSAEVALSEVTKSNEAALSTSRALAQESDALKASLESKVKKIGSDDIQVKFNALAKTACQMLGVDSIDAAVKMQRETKQRIEAKLSETTRELETLTSALQTVKTKVDAAEADASEKKARTAKLIEQLKGDFSTNPVERQISQLETELVNEVSRTKSLEEQMAAVERETHEQLRRIATYSAEAADVVSHHDGRKAQDRAFFKEKAATVESSLAHLENVIKERTNSAKRAQVLAETKGVIAAPAEYKYNRIEFRY